uniref:Si:dkey-156n14.3 n=1 Tax=Paramormyrops kingsleyae TaxID=1676925 RepID=A0A3B3TGH7_9TELE
MCSRYRDTKMEIQGLIAAQNLQRQHGVSCRADLSRPGRRTGGSCRSTPSDIGAADGPVLHESASGGDNNNNSGSRPGTSPLLLQENGSGGGPPAPERNCNKSNTGVRCVDAGLGLLVGLRGKGAGRHRPRRGCPDTGRRCGLEHGDGDLQMAIPIDLQQGSQQRPRCQPDSNPGLEESATGPRAVTGCSARVDGGAEEELYVVFNVARGGEGAASKEADSPGAVRSAAVEVPYVSGRSRPGDSSGHLSPRNARKSRPAGASPRSRPLGRCDAGVTPPRRGPEPGTGEGDDDGDGGAMASRCSAERDGSEGDADAIERIHTGVPGRSAPGDSAPFVEALPLSDAGSAYLSGGCIATGSANVTQSDDAFSGTITINNQSIVVTIENGVLTLAAPSEGHSQREDSFSLKEHLGLKEHQDVVLISYDGTTKSTGRNGNATVGCVQYEESRTCLPVSDPGLALEEDCSFSDPGSVLADVHGSKEDGAFCALAQGDAVDSGSKDGVHGELMACDGLPSTKLGGCAGMVPKKGAPASYRCPQSDCGRTFDAKHKLKMHLLSHAEDQRPFKCPVEGCGWSFTTSYKLKRHLQSHDKARPFACEWENCGRRFTTVYNLKAHARAHGREGAFVCSTCSERFRSAARLGSHQRSHFEPERPHRCEFPGCEKTFITFSALFSHNRTHFRETGQFICNYPGCDKRYDKACRLKIHLRSHTGERPFVCDSEGCGWSFTSMSKLLRHKRKHEDDRRFICQQEGCGKSFTRAEHLKGHSITHLGTKPFECPVEGCTAKFSARSSLYIHSKKHQVDRPLRSRCPVTSCSKCFSSRGSLKSHMMKHHNLSPDLLSQLEMSTSLTPSSELTSTGPAAGDMDLGSLFSGVPSGGTGVAGVPGTGGASTLTMDMSLVSSGILTIDAASVSATLGGAGGALAQAVDPLILAAGAEVGPAGFDAGAGSVLPQAALNLEDVQTVNPEALGSLAALALRPPTGSEHLHALSSTSALASDPPAPLAPSSSLATSSGPGLLSAASEPDQGGGGGALLGGTDVLSQQEGSKVVTQFVFPGHGGSFSAQKDTELHAVPACSFLESGGSARTDYRAIQLAKRKKQKGPAGAPGSSVGQRKSKGGKGGGSSVTPGAPAGGRFSESVASASGGLTLRDPVTGAQYVQIQLLQDDPSGDGDLAFQLSSQTSSSHSQLTVDLPVNILQEPPVTAEDDTGSETSQFTGSTINLQDLE